MMREYDIKQWPNHFSPRDYFRDCRVKWMVRPPERQFEERTSFVDVAGERAVPKPSGPTLRLKSGMQLTDVVQKNQSGQSLTNQWRQRAIGCGSQAVANDRELNHSQEYRSNVH